MKPRALDLFCGAGGASMGLYRAGFDVTGVDWVNQPRYPFKFRMANALSYPLEGFDFIWASPPCQAYTLMRHMGKNAGNGAPELVEPIRQRLLHSSIPFVIENVIGSPLRNAIKLCGSSFGLRVRRHRVFEASHVLFTLPCAHDGFPVPVWGDGRPSRQEARRAIRPIAVYSDHPQTPGDDTYRCNRAKTLVEGQQAMGIDWMEWRELTQAIPPAYSEFIGKQALQYIDAFRGKAEGDAK